MGSYSLKGYGVYSLKGYVVFCRATKRVLGRVLAYNDTDARRSAAAYGWTNIELGLA